MVAKDALKPTCSGGQATIECYAPGSTHFNIGNVPNPPPAPLPHFDASNCQVKDEVSTSCCNAAATGPELIDGQCCYGFCTGACCGRPLLVEGAQRLAPISARADWGSPLNVSHSGLAPRAH